VRRRCVIRAVLARVLVLSVVCAVVSGCSRHAAAPPFVELHVATDGEFLAFVPAELTCPAGAHVRLYFRHGGRRIPQKHNWVLLLPGSEQAVEKEGTAAGEAANWVPRGDPRVLAATPLCGPGGEAVIDFTAPSPGDYPFICSTPGHGAEMNGVLHVTRS
jgi:azurin